MQRRLERQQMVAGGAGTEDLLATVLRLRQELRDHRRDVTVIRDAVDSLQGAPPWETIKMAAALLCRDFGFARVLVSAVQDQEWLPRHLYVRAVGESKSQSFNGLSIGTPIALAMSSPENEVIRNQAGVAVSAGANGQGYLVAPIVSEGTVVGLLHAQFPESPVVTVAGRVDLFEAFTECLGVVYESAVLNEKASQLRMEVEKLRVAVNRVELSARVSPSMGLTALPDNGIGYEGEPPAAPELTDRQREVMSHLATGATNRDIARCLLISEDTVKSHLKQIAAKFNTTTRAAALALYLEDSVGMGVRGQR
jgi:DNA-binding CsgD family transcriptional regulator